MNAPTIQQPKFTKELRDAIPSNRFNFAGIDHFGIPCRDPDLSGLFVEQVLGGVELRRFGYSEEDRRLGRLRHIFYHLGQQVLEVVEQEDNVSYPRADTNNSNPHWAWRVSPEDMKRFMDHLTAEGIPFNGPRSHASSLLISLYFRDIDGNNLEVCTYDPVPEGLFETTLMGGKYGLIPWANIAHNWRPKA